MQGAPVQSLVQEDHTCYWAIKPMPQLLSLRSGLVSHNNWAPVLWLLKHPRACAPQQEKLPQWKPHVLQLKSSPYSPQLNKAQKKQWDSAQPKINKNIFLKNHLQKHFLEIKPVNPKENQPWIFTGRTDDAAETSKLWPPDAKSRLIGKDPDTGKDWTQEKGMIEDKMVGWHLRLKGHDFE